MPLTFGLHIVRTAIWTIFFCLLSVGEAAGTTNLAQAVPLPPLCSAEKYPPLAVRLNISGSTVVGFAVAADGSAKKPYIIRSSGYEILDQASIDCALSMHFQTNGGASEISKQFRFLWSMDGGIVPPAETGDAFHVCPLDLPSATLDQVHDFAETKMLLSDSGKIESISISHKSGSDTFDQAVLNCVSRWKYSPMLQDRVPKETTWFAIVRLNGTHTVEVTDEPTPVNRCTPVSPTAAESINKTALISYDPFENKVPKTLSLSQSTGDTALDNASMACAEVVINQPAYRQLVPLKGLRILWRDGVGQIVQ